jgi:hypothetical protein
MTKTIAVVWLVGVAGLAGGAQPSPADLAYSELQVSLVERDWRAVIGHARVILAVQPERWDMHRLAGDAFMKLDSPIEAAVHFREWVRLQPDDALAAAALQQTVDRQRAIDDQRGARERDRETVRRLTYKPSLAALARERAREKTAAIATVELGAGRDLEPMRERALAAMRPVMQAAAGDARRLEAARQRYAEACESQGTVSRSTDALREGRQRSVRARMDLAQDGAGRSWADWTWVQERRLPPSTEGQSAECRALAGDVNRFANVVDGALGRSEDALAKPPAVYRGVREEVFTRLADELW